MDTFVGKTVTAEQFRKRFKSIVTSNWEKLAVRFKKNQIMSRVVKRTIVVQRTHDMLEANAVAAAERGFALNSSHRSETDFHPHAENECNGMSIGEFIDKSFDAAENLFKSTGVSDGSLFHEVLKFEKAGRPIQAGMLNFASRTFGDMEGMLFEFSTALLEQASGRKVVKESTQDVLAVIPSQTTHPTDCSSRSGLHTRSHGVVSVLGKIKFMSEANFLNETPIPFDKSRLWQILETLDSPTLVETRVSPQKVEKRREYLHNVMTITEVLTHLASLDSDDLQALEGKSVVALRTGQGGGMYGANKPKFGWRYDKKTGADLGLVQLPPDEKTFDMEGSRGFMSVRVPEMITNDPFVIEPIGVNERITKKEIIIPVYHQVVTSRDIGLLTGAIQDDQLVEDTEIPEIEHKPTENILDQVEELAKEVAHDGLLEL